MKKIVTLAFAFFYMLLSFEASGATIKMGIRDFGNRQSSDELRKLFSERAVLDEMARCTNHTLELITIPIRRQRRALLNHQVDLIFTVVPNDNDKSSFEENFTYMLPPMADIRMGNYQRTGFSGQASTYGSLPITKEQYQLRYSENDSVVIYDNPNALVLALLRGRVDEIEVIQQVADYFASKNSTFGSIQLVREATPQSIYITMLESSLGTEDVVQLSNCMTQLREDGTVRRLLDPEQDGIKSYYLNFGDTASTPDH